jgi:hypothetical protein
MLKLILAFYIVSGNGAVAVHTQVMPGTYPADKCETAGKKIQKDSSRSGNQMPGGIAFQQTLVLYSCTE